MLKHCIQTRRKSSENEKEHKVDDSISVASSVASSGPYAKGRANKAFVHTDSTSSRIKSDPDKHGLQYAHNKSRQSSISTTSPGRDAANFINLDSIAEETVDSNNIKEVSTNYSMRKTFLFASFVMAFVICVCFGVGHYFIGYFPESANLNEGDTKLIEYSTYFCSGVYTASRDIWLTVLSRIVLTKSVIHSRKTRLKIDVGTVWRRNFYLTKNTLLNMTVNSRDIVEFLVFRGEQSWKIWSERKQSAMYLFKYICCVNIPGKQQETYGYKIEHEDDYYIVLHRSNDYGIAASVNITLELTRPTYEYSKTTRQCKSSKSKSCSVALDYASNEKTIIEVPAKYAELTIPKAVNVEWKCEARIWFYVVAFTCAFILLILIAVIIYHLTGERYIKACSLLIAKNKKEKLRYTVEYNDNRKRTVITGQAEYTASAKPDSRCKSSVSDSVSYESIAKYHNFALEDDDDSLELTKQGTNGDLDTSGHSNNINKHTPTGIATIYREDYSNVKRNSIAITKYVAPKQKERRESLQEESEEVMLSWPHDSVPSSTLDRPQHATLKVTRSTGYFRVHSPMIQSRTGGVAGQRELRSPNPLFYRPGSEMSSLDEVTVIEDGTEL